LLAWNSPVISGSTTLDSKRRCGFSSCLAVKPEECMGVIHAARSVFAWQLAAIFAGILGLLSADATSLEAQAAPVSYGPAVCSVPDSVHGKLERIARRVRGNVGIGAIHLESGTRLSLNGDRAFPMASVSKVPMALEFLRRVDAGEISLHETIVVPPTEFRPGNSPLAKWSRGRSVRVTIDSLFSLMLGISDNTATDCLAVPRRRRGESGSWGSMASGWTGRRHAPSRISSASPARCRRASSTASTTFG
jgi:hypothetical protein